MITYTCRRLSSQPINLLNPLVKLGTSSQLSNEIREHRSHTNKLVLESLDQIRSLDMVQYRKDETPWRVLVKPRRHRVVDMVGIIQDEHRIEMEMVVDKLHNLCDVEMYVVIVPTVGYGKARVFAQSLFWEWYVGGELGNGVLILLAQHEASFQIVASYAFDEYFGETFAKLVVADVLQPALMRGEPSLGMLATTYAIARHAQECRELWKPKYLTHAQKNQVRFMQHAVYYGIFHTKTFWITLFVIAVTVNLWMRILEMTCNECGQSMRRVTDPADILNGLSQGERVEFENECAMYRVFRCPGCKKFKSILVSRDYHNYHRCLQCTQCEYYTTTVKQDILRLPSKQEDGVKQFHYHCKNCQLEKKIHVPLYRPMEENPKEWYEFLLERAMSPQGERKSDKASMDAFTGK